MIYRITKYSYIITILHHQSIHNDDTVLHDDYTILSYHYMIKSIQAQQQRQQYRYTSKLRVIMSSVHSKTASIILGTYCATLSPSFSIAWANSDSTSGSLARAIFRCDEKRNNTQQKQINNQIVLSIKKTVEWYSSPEAAFSL